MLRIEQRTRQADRRWQRRQFLTIGSLGLAALGCETWGGSSLPNALSLPGLLRRSAVAGESGKLVSGKSVIFIFQQGGPSQYETFDPKLQIADGMRTMTPVIETSLPGVRFGESMHQLAELANQLTIVRTFQSNNGAHNIQPIVGPETLQANIGSLYSRVVGPTRPDTGLSTNMVLFPDAVCRDVLKGKARGDISATGSLGGTYAPFIPGADGQLQKDMRLTLSPDRFEDRQQLMKQFAALRQRVEGSESLSAVDRLQQQAYQVLLSGDVAKALDLSREDARTIAAYDTAQYVRPDGWSKAQRGKQGMYTGHAKAIGKQLLLARRLCEAGVGFVTIHTGYDGVWDMHADGNNLNMIDGMEAVGRAFDHAVAALIRDLQARNLQNDILVVATGEMGRTPRINKNGGRDHWGKLTPLLLYGGGLRPGQVIGRSTKDGGEPAEEANGPQHLVSTILRTQFSAGALRLVPSMGQVSRLADHPPIPVEMVN
ncbi:MAG: DUF1501 domain-containing protein [Planctomycetota bacterium]